MKNSCEADWPCTPRIRITQSKQHPRAALTQFEEATQEQLLLNCSVLRAGLPSSLVWKGYPMQMIILESEFGRPDKVRCPTCAQSMHLVGIESHPTIPDMVDLDTYECACGEVIAEPRLSELAIGALVH